jgi:4-hydroxybutyrate CoA-transferase
VIGAWHSKGGRSITVLPSTAKEGSVSRIVPSHSEGIVVTIPRNCVDYVVTEYGIAHLKGKSLRHRSEELIGIAHPDFRPELRKYARKFFWP